MPIKPKPFAYVCPSCGWRKAVSPKSDVLMPGDYYQSCPTCGTRPLKREEFNALTELKIGLFDKIFKH